MTKWPRAGSGGAGIVFMGLLLVSSGLPASSVAAASDLRLVDAVRRGHMDVARALIKQHADVNTPQPDGTTPLHWAAERSDTDMVSLLVGAGAKTNRATRSESRRSLRHERRRGDRQHSAAPERIPTGFANRRDTSHDGRTGRGSSGAIEAGGASGEGTLAGQTLMWAIAEGIRMLRGY